MANTLTQSTDPPTTVSDDPFLVHQWVLAAIASAAARFVPLPFIDDIIRDRSRQFVIARTLAAHDRTFSSRDLAPLYGGSSSWFRGAIRSITGLPLKLLLFPIRKLVKIFGSVRGVPLDLMRTILIGRTVERCLQKGLFREDDKKERRLEQAEQVREAMDEAFKGIDWVTVQSVLKDSIGQISELKDAAMDVTQQVFGKDDVDPDEIEAGSMEEDDQVASSAEEVKAAMQRPETLQIFAKYDAKFDDALRLV